MNLFGLNVGIQGWEKYCLRQSLTAAALFLGLNAAALAIDDAIVVPDATTRLTPYTSTTDNLPHNVKLGPMDISLIAGLRTTYSDNINLAHDNRMEDIYFSPYVETSAIWAVTEYNTLHLGLGLSYNKYVMHPEADSRAPILTPESDTGFDFDFQIDDFRFTVYDHISYAQDPIDNAALSNVTNYGRFDNIVGLRAAWNVTADLELAAGVAQENWFSESSEFNYLNRSTQIFDASATYQMGPATFVGLQGSAYIDSYEQHIQNSGTRYSVGPFIRTKLTKTLDMKAGASFELGNFSTGGSNGDTSNLSSYAMYLTLNHRFNRYISQSLSVIRGNDLGTYSNYVESWRVQHNANWAIINNVSVGTELFVEFADDSGGFSSDSYSRYGGGVSLGYRVTPHLTSTLGYNYIEKESRYLERSYYQNSVTLDLRYNF